MPRRSALALTALAALILTGCSTTASDNGRPTIVASTNVYGQIAKAVGGDDVNVTSIISSAAQDPHEYEASPKDKLDVSHADLIVANGGGYDAFLNGLITDDSVPVIEAVSFAKDLPADAGTDDHDHEGEHAEEHADEHTDAATESEHAHGEDEHGHTHIEGFNEHVWYDPAIAGDVALDIAEHLAKLDPDHAADYKKRADAFVAETKTLITRLETNAATLDHTHIMVTEPVSLRLTDIMGLHNVTPEAFTEAVEEGQDVAPAVLLQTLNLFTDEDVKVVIANTQTGGSETEQLISKAETLNIPVLEFSEVLPDGSTYIEWMTKNVHDLETALKVN